MNKNTKNINSEAELRQALARWYGGETSAADDARIGAWFATHVAPVDLSAEASVFGTQTAMKSIHAAVMNTRSKHRRRWIVAASSLVAAAAAVLLIFAVPGAKVAEQMSLEPAVAPSRSLTINMPANTSNAKNEPAVADTLTVKQAAAVLNDVYALLSNKLGKADAGIKTADVRMAKMQSTLNAIEINLTVNVDKPTSLTK